MGLRGLSIDGASLRKQRQISGLTQEKLSRLADCDTRTIRNAEKGQNLDLATIENIAKAIKVPVTWLTKTVDLVDASKSADRKRLIVQSQLTGLIKKDPRLILNPLAKNAALAAPGFELPLPACYRRTTPTNNRKTEGFLFQLFEQFQFLRASDSAFFASNDLLFARVCFLVLHLNTSERFTLYMCIETEFEQDRISNQIVFGNLHEIEKRWQPEN